MGKGKRETVFSLAKGKFTAKHITTPVIQNIFTAQMAIWGNRGDLKRKFYKMEAPGMSKLSYSSSNFQDLEGTEQGRL